MKIGDRVRISANLKHLSRDWRGKVGTVERIHPEHSPILYTIVVGQTKLSFYDNELEVVG